MQAEKLGLRAARFWSVAALVFVAGISAGLHWVGQYAPGAIAEAAQPGISSHAPTSLPREEPPAAPVVESPRIVEVSAVTTTAATNNTQPANASEPAPIVRAKKTGRPQKEFQVLTARDGTQYRQVTVERAEPDGLSISFKPATGGFGMVKLKFKNLPEEIQQQYDYDPQAAGDYEKEKATRQARALAESIAAGKLELAREDAEESSALTALSRIVSDYHQSHTYMGSNGQPIFACVDMACDVWNMVVTRGFKAKLLVGNVDKETKALAEANHAWVIAEVSPKKWIALESTSGRLISEQENPRYYVGTIFPSPRELKSASSLIQQHNDTVEKKNNAARSYTDLLEQYNKAAPAARQQLALALAGSAASLKDRAADLAEIRRQLDALLVKPE